MIEYGRRFVSMKILAMYSPRTPIEAMESPPSIHTETRSDAQPDSSVPLRRRTIKYIAPTEDRVKMALPSKKTKINGFSLNDVRPSSPTATRRMT